MTITKEKKKEVIETFQKSKNDTGSSEVQIAILTERISNLTEHMKIHKKDFHSRHGLLMLVTRRRSLLDYLKKYYYDRYLKVIAGLGIRK